jgi:predicted nuclease of predicted toxin-antitoxin system
MLAGEPRKLLLVSTGNIANADLEDIFVPQIPVIATAFETYDYLELTRTNLIFHS